MLVYLEDVSSSVKFISAKIIIWILSKGEFKKITYTYIKRRIIQRIRDDFEI